MTGGRRDRARRVSGGLGTLCVVVLLGLATAGFADGGRGRLGSGGSDGASGSGSAGCSVAELRVTPTVDYSPGEQAYVISTVAFDALPEGCEGRAYHLTFAAISGTTLLEMRGILEAEAAVTLPEAGRPRAESVATTTLTVLADDAAS